eukprot:13213353-Alexandrium_andersonii.AAC.1
MAGALPGVASLRRRRPPQHRSARRTRAPRAPAAVFFAARYVGVRARMLGALHWSRCPGTPVSLAAAAAAQR